MKLPTLWSLRTLARAANLAAAALLAAVAAGVTPGATAQAAPLPQTNLLVNANMESFTGGVASSWDPWWSEVPNPGTGSLDYVVKPNWVSESNPTFVQSGSASQHIGRNWDPWFAGIRQTVTAPAGSTVRFIVYGRVFASNTDWPVASDANVNARMQIGAEPNGSIEWFSPSVRWSGMASPHDTWSQFTLDVVTGASGRVTLFLSANFRGDSRYHLDVWWDNASAVVVSQAPSPGTNPTAAPGATQPPAGQAPTNPPPASTAFATPTAGADGTIIYVVQPGDSLWRIAAVSGLTVDQIKSMNGLTGDFISVGQRLIIGYSTPQAPEATETATPDANAPTASATAATEVAAGPTPAPAATTGEASAGTGTVCALLYNDENGNGIRDTTETMLAGGQLTVVDTGTGSPVGHYSTDGLSEPHCFENLPAGPYSISSVAPGGYNATTDTAHPLNVEAGSTASLEFGAQPSANAAEPTPAPRSSRVLQTALLGAGGVIFLLMAAGVAAFMFLRRPR